MELPLRPSRDDNNAIFIGHGNIDDRIAPVLFHLIQVDLDHDRTRNPLTDPDRPGKIIATLARGRSQREIVSGLACHGITKIGPEAEIQPDKAVLPVPVARGLGDALRIHQVAV